MAEIYRDVVGCLCEENTPEAFYAGLRMVAVDGFVLDLPDSSGNCNTFGRPKNGDCFGPFPQLRVVSLCEVGSHVFFSFLAKPVNSGEATMAKHVYRSLPSRSLLLFDIGFCASGLMLQILKGESHFLGRSKMSRCFRKQTILSDGSYLSQIYSTDHDRVYDRRGTIVRVIEYTLDDPQRTGNQEEHRLITSLLDPVEHPAKQLISLYHERWETELAIDECKTHMRERATFRSHRPAGVIQELYGLMIAHFAIRKLAFEAAALSEIAPRRISFTGTIKILQARLPEVANSPRLFADWYRRLLEEVSVETLPPRRNRINPRVIKRKQSKWLKKQEKDRNLPLLQKKFSDAVVMLT
jgi:hypothetical protein